MPAKGMAIPSLDKAFIPGGSMSELRIS
jgi:hypothetical protein